MHSYYKVLGVAQTATAAELKAAYRKQAKRLHPDVNGGTAEAEQRFKQLKEAYETLSDPIKRQAYDAGGGQGAATPGDKGQGKASASGASAGRASSEGTVDNHFDPAHAAQAFDRFFGFHPDSKKRSDSSGRSSSARRNPLDVTDRFNHFFGKR
ncbi:J domain-containing protein [Paenibacillus sp. SYP-B4298]|uniref:J domain-containing protein n=1 Tax=Paenibacillus sp. SYP-B4298 TaxID=2996034 RepID=UPI0022DD9C2F|nr:DnaJ domain-containing protein [Paenibacillus sp. SYP-B4298]